MKSNGSNPSTHGNSNASNGVFDNRNTWFEVSLKSVFVAFEKAKAPMAIVQELSSANFFVALRPGTQTTEHCKIVEVLVPASTSTEAIHTRLKGSFADVAAVTSECNVYSVAVPSLCFKQVAEALRNCTYNVGGLERVNNGQAYFTVKTALGTTPAHLAAAFDDVHIEATCIELTHPTREATAWNQTNSAASGSNVANPVFAPEYSIV